MTEDEGQEQELKYDVPSWLQNILDLASECGDAMFAAEQYRKNSQTHERADNKVHEFKASLRQVYFWYEPKFDYSDSIELGDDLEDKLDGAADVYKLSFDEARKLFRKIRDLMEELKHTKFEGGKHTDTGY